MRVLGIGLIAACLSGLLPARLLVPQQVVFKTGVDLVRVDALVTIDGRPVAGLGPSDFEILDEGVPQVVEMAYPVGPVDVILVLDVSGSVRGERFEALVQSARALLRELRQNERLALVTFNDRVALRSSLTIDRDGVSRLLDAIVPGGNTALNDAVFAGLSLANNEARSLLLLFSDGAENSSWLSAAQVIEAAKETDAVVCPVCVGAGTGTRSGRFLHGLADGTGGRLFRADSVGALRSSLLAVLTEFRSRYVIAYVPAGVPRDDRWHRIEIRVKGRRAEITARRGYAARAPG